ncbi:arabinogalactan oligomer / maltooligosaccharide transport system substrate-binding protein [Candidatus Hakubella thermalkaliphila]|uniref:Arabinogalactan oligomer / maltooligosaccharide transport system substrate-binding protein n=1 Tax=Candidatus Hakubella thermalkaliphila TaxID=2754717 RepID=A0A6V8NRB6_9ACTN|nr:maltose ABC transporter substrate-binding protein [Candidatus Hakubella thermalkaliphila]GFP21821.1 arabinogalactan oligomer / maltooligosaccharide transport system substrate-binding protein [Candidatus Hakubella thermalkaliphila]
MNRATWLKLIAVGLATAGLFFLGVACAPAPTIEEVPPPPAEEEVAPAEEPGIVAEEGAELTVWESEDASGEWLQDVAKLFTEKYGIPVTFEPVAHIDAPGKLKTDGPAGLGADVFAAPHDHVGSMVAGGLIYPNDVSDPADFVDAAVAGVSFQGIMYGYPIGIETYALLYNKDLVDELPETWDELIEFAAEFNDIPNNRFGFMMEPANFYYVYAFIGGHGGYVFGDGNTNPDDIGLNNAGAIEGAKFLQRLKGILPLHTADITYDIKAGLFNDGNLAFNLDGPWAVAGHRDAGVNFGVVPLPILPNGERPTSFSGIRSLFVSSFTEYPMASKLFAQFVTSKELLAKRFTDTGQLPPRFDLVDDPAITADPIAAAFLQQAQYAVPMPSIPEMMHVWGPMATALDLIWNEGGDPKPVLDKAVQHIKDAIELAR